LCALEFDFIFKIRHVRNNNNKQLEIYLEGIDVHTVEHSGVVVATNINDQVTPVGRFERVHRVKKKEGISHVFNGRKLFARLAINQSESRLNIKFY
jgi:hypothetical protein